jgi:excisionase family DNA binding protein
VGKPAGTRSRGLPSLAKKEPVAERLVLTTALDPYLSLRALASYAGLSVRKLRDHLDDPAHPLPCYRVGGKMLVRRSEFDAWILAYRHRGGQDVDGLVRDVMRGLS